MASGVLDLGTLAYTVQVNGAEEAKTTMGELKEELREAGTDGQRDLDALTESSGKLGKIGMAAIAAGAAAAGTALLKLGKASVEFADNWQGAMHDFQARTGASTEEMAAFEETAERLYNANFGESINDIAQSMAEVKQQTGQTGTALEDTTKYALMLRDTFDWDVRESVRSVDMMMRQFGITAEEAYTLLAQGAQNGLDKNDNLLDSLNEYSTYFAQLGFDAEQTFNMLAAGAESGTFDIDKLGDAMKEFGIRVKDGSDTTVEAFRLLGLNADEMQAKFAAGGPSAQAAFAQVLQALQETDDAVTKNTVGINLFGTMWEDLEVKTMSAMLAADEQFSKTAGTLQAIEVVKYDTIGAAMQGIGRNMETALLQPIGEALLPLLQSVANWTLEHMPEIQQTVETTLSVIGTALGVLIAVVTGDVDKLSGYLDAALGGIKTKVSNATKEQVETVKASCKAMKTNISDMGRDAAQSLQNMTDSAKQSLSNLKQSAIQTMQQTVDGVKAKGAALVNAGKSVAQDMLQELRALPSQAAEIGRDFVDGIIRGIGNAGAALRRAASNLASSALDTIKDKFEIASPSKVMRRYGVFLGEGLAIGIDDTDNLVKNAMQRLAGGANNAFDVNASLLVDSVQKERVSATQKKAAAQTGMASIQNIFHVAATIRNEEDIERTARELYQLQQADARGKGVVLV